jgi:hypothetical protein
MEVSLSDIILLRFNIQKYPTLSKNKKIKHSVLDIQIKAEGHAKY